jgi:NAD(P)-dependent dehydrogenase (short-subunit alcohol dehydrogenase family)
MGGLTDGKAGLVTGAASGIGRACALRFAQEGAAVVVADLPGAVEGGEVTVEQMTAAGTFLGMKHQIAQMLTQDMPNRGAIVNTSSNAGLMEVMLLSAYAASKHGILGLTKNAAVEYADSGIRVNAVCPGAVMTPLMSKQPPERQQEILAPQAMSRPGDAAEVAAAVVWLCSDEASFVTGVALPVDGGSLAWLSAHRA